MHMILYTLYIVLWMILGTCTIQPSFPWSQMSGVAPPPPYPSEIALCWMALTGVGAVCGWAGCVWRREGGCSECVKGILFTMMAHPPRWDISLQWHQTGKVTFLDSMEKEVATFSVTCIDYIHTCTQVVHMHTYQGNDEARGQLKCMFLDHHILQTHERTHNSCQHTRDITSLPDQMWVHNHRTMRQGN